MEPKGSIPIDPNVEFGAEETDKPHTFYVHTGDRKYYMAASVCSHIT